MEDKRYSQREKLIKGLYDMQKNNGEIPGMTYIEYKLRFDKANEALGIRREDNIS